MTKENFVILVDESDKPVGVMEKMQAHKEGVLHRAFSVFVFDGAGNYLLQQRAAVKYHGGSLWTNACCSHPAPGIETSEAAVQRLQQEMGFATEVEKLFSFTYKAEVENGLIEHEFDHVYAAVYEGPIAPDAAEVADHKYISPSDLADNIMHNPQDFTIWFRIIFPRIEEWRKDRFENHT